MIRRVFLICTWLLAILVTEAKRGAPVEVLPVKVGNIEYSVPHRNGTQKQMGYLNARDVKSGKLIWSRQIYAVKYDPNMERDIQDIFITSITVQGNHLFITNERNSKYQLDLKTFEVKVIKASWVEEN
jgi:hypothetical protein